MVDEDGTSFVLCFCGSRIDHQMSAGSPTFVKESARKSQDAAICDDIGTDALRQHSSVDLAPKMANSFLHLMPDRLSIRRADNLDLPNPRIVYVFSAFWFLVVSIVLA